VVEEVVVVLVVGVAQERESAGVWIRRRVNLAKRPRQGSANVNGHATLLLKTPFLSL
jgi:hypothetical protein